MGFFKEEDVAKAVEAIQFWKKANPEAAKSLQAVWKEQYLTAGHKTLAREILKETK